MASEVISEIVLQLKDIELLEFYGEQDKKLNKIRSFFPDININSRGDILKLYGSKSDTQRAKSKIEVILRWIKEKDQISEEKIEQIILAKTQAEIFVDEKIMSAYTIVHGRNGRNIIAKTKNQIRLVDCSINNDVCFAIGPAGTGKTYTAVALAVKALKSQEVRRIVLTRPAVEAGESLGFLPGDLKEKIDPYLRPLYDALNDMIPQDKLNHLMEKNAIEIAPLAFMRGRTLDHSFIILDEAQNATQTQLKMFLTRLGPNAKCIITGDLSQIDLPRTQQSGLSKTIDLLKHLKGIGVVRLTAEDVVRHRLVKDIILAFGEHRKNIKKPKSKGQNEEG